MKLKGARHLKPEAEEIPLERAPIEPHPEIKIDGEPQPIAGMSPEAQARIEQEQADAEPVGEALGAQTAADANRSRLQEQIAALRQSEQLQREHYTRVASFRPPATTL
jgi:hypothetical protein